MTALDAMIICTLFLFFTMGSLLLVSEIVQRLEKKSYEDAEDGGDWMDV